MLSAERVHLSYLLTLCVTSPAELLLSYRNNLNSTVVLNLEGKDYVHQDK